MHPSTPQVTAETVRTYLQLNRLLDSIQQGHPEVSAPLRLTLLRARRDGNIASLDERRFRAVVAGVNPRARPMAQESLRPPTAPLPGRETDRP